MPLDKKQTIPYHRFMIVRNTSKYPTEEVKKLIEFAVNGFGNKVCVNVKNSASSYHGRAYPYVPNVSNAPKSSKYLITVRIGSPDKFPKEDYYSNTKYKRLTPFTYNTWQEAMMAVAAHEFRHIYQFIKNKPRSEVDASKYAYKKLMEYRNL